MEEFLIKAPESIIGVTPLGDSNPEITESSLTDNFTNYCYAITITLKGAYHIRSMADKLHQQYEFLKKIIKDHINEQCHSYLFYFEKHKCGSWIHTHGIIHPQTKVSIVKIKQAVYLAIEKQKLKSGQSYKRRVLIDSLHDLNNWWNYCKKEEELWYNSENKQIKKIYKFQYKIKNNKFLLNFD